MQCARLSLISNGEEDLYLLLDGGKNEWKIEIRNGFGCERLKVLILK